MISRLELPATNLLTKCNRRARGRRLVNRGSATLSLYSIDREETKDFGTRCLMARRLVQRGVRFIQLYSGGP